MDDPKKMYGNELETTHASDTSRCTGSPSAYAHSSTHDLRASAGHSEYIGAGPRRVPRCPYIVGSTFTATMHEPPPPFGHDYTTQYPDLPETWEKMSQLDSCLSRPSLGGRSITHTTREMTITAAIRSGYGAGAQILVINNNMVAKIYDPLYYEFIDEFGYTEPVICNADGDYVREAAAYTELQQSTAATEITPIYHGSFTVEIGTCVTPHDDKLERLVPLILVEYLRGQTMDSIKPRTFSDEVRSAIIKKVLVAEIVILHAGVDHYDYSPRNIILLNLGESPSALTPEYVHDHVQVKVIDFNVSVVNVHPSHKYRRYYEGEVVAGGDSQKKMQSPIVRYHGQMMEFYDWVPRGRASAEKWLWHHFRDDGRFQPVIWDPDDPHKSPKYVDDPENDTGSSDSGISMKPT